MDMQRIAYRVSRVGSGRRSGDLIEPGDFGRAVREHGDHAVRESAFEAVRAEDFPDRVSRLEATFAFLSPEMALKYAELTEGHAEEVWIVVVDPEARVTTGDIGWLARGRGPAPDQEYWRRAAHEYWSGRPTTVGLQEVVIGGRIRLLCRLGAS
jgi:hypothetical protein